MHEIVVEALLIAIYLPEERAYTYRHREILWWGQLVTSPLWAQELSFEHLLEIARAHTDRQQAGFLPKRVSGFCLPIVAMPSQSYNQPFGTPLSPSQYDRQTVLPIPSH